MRRILAPLVAASLVACAAETSSPKLAAHLQVLGDGPIRGTPGRALDPDLQLRVLDETGRPLPGEVVQWTVLLGGGTLLGSADTSDLDGLVTATWVLGPEVGAQKIRADALSGTSIEIEVDAEVFRTRGVAVADRAVCALDQSGDPWCWGDGWQWAGDTSLAIPQTLPAVPTRLTTGQDFVEIVAGNEHWCARTSTGGVWCWARWSFAATGRHPSSTLPRMTPAPVEGAPAFTTLGAAQYHTCGIDVDGQAWCWGNPEHPYALGGYAPNEWQLARVYQPLGVRFSRITGGWSHTCAISTDGRAWCWGYNRFGETADTSLAGHMLRDPVPLPQPVLEIAAGDAHSCAVVQSGALYCWGADLSETGQLIGSRSWAIPRTVVTPGMLRIASGWSMLYGLRSGRAVFWGDLLTPEYRLRPESGFSARQPTPVHPKLTNLVQISGQTTFACGRRSNDELHCWGLVPGFGLTAEPVPIPAPAPLP